MDTQNTYSRLLDIIRPVGKASVCLSGGSDSALVAIAAVEALGKDNVIAITAHTPFFTGEELKDSHALAKKLGIRHFIPAVALMENKNVLANHEDRCYYCKQCLMRVIREEAEREGFPNLLDGSIQDPASAPDGKARVEYNVLSPLREAGIQKSDIATLLKYKGMRGFIRPSNACLATRIAIDEPITVKKLRWIRAAENYLRSMGFAMVRVRVKGGHARIEVDKARVPDLLDMEEDVVAELKGMGYKSVTIDPEGYKYTGSCFRK